MEIKTKFNLGDTVFFMDRNSVATGYIESFRIDVSGSEINFTTNSTGYIESFRIDVSTDCPYLDGNILHWIFVEPKTHISRKEYELFPTKQALLDSL